MVKVPTPQYQGSQPLGTVQLEPAATPFQTTSAPDMSAKGRALQQLGEAGMAMAATLNQRKQDVTIREQQQKFFELERELTDPQTGIFARRGAAANGASDEIANRVDALTANMLKDDRLTTSGRLALEQWTMGQQARLVGRAVNHELDETRAYETQLVQAQLDAVADRAASDYTSTNAAAAAITQAEQAANTLADMQGQPALGAEGDDVRQAMIKEAISRVHTTRILAASNDNPELALKMLEDNKDSIDPDQYNKFKPALTAKAEEAQGDRIGTALAAGKTETGVVAAPYTGPIRESVKQLPTGAVRNQRISPIAQRNLSYILDQMGEGWDLQLVSGKQMTLEEIKAAGGERKWVNGKRVWVLDGKVVHVGSERHDDGHTADVTLTKNGVVVTPSQDEATYLRFAELAAPWFPGIGHYDGWMHIGGGPEAAWGPSGSKDTLAPQYKEAIERGRANAGKAAPLNIDAVMQDESLSLGVREQAFTSYNRVVASQTRNDKVAVDTRINELFTLIDEAYLDGYNPSFNIDQHITTEDRMLLGTRLTQVRSWAHARATGDPVVEEPGLYVDVLNATKTAEGVQKFLEVDIPTEYRGRLRDDQLTTLVARQQSMLADMQKLTTEQRIAQGTNPVSRTEIADAINPALLAVGIDMRAPTSAEMLTDAGRKRAETIYQVEEYMDYEIMDFVAKNKRKPNIIEMRALARGITARVSSYNPVGPTIWTGRDTGVIGILPELPPDLETFYRTPLTVELGFGNPVELDPKVLHAINSGYLDYQTRSGYQVPVPYTPAEIIMEIAQNPRLYFDTQKRLNELGEGN